jgi:hypothetical protein
MDSEAPLTEERGARSARSEGLVITPGGFRPRSRVHLVEPDMVLDGTGNRLRKLNPSGDVVAEFDVIQDRPAPEALLPRRLVQPREVPAAGSNWITYALWQNMSDLPITFFATTWIVPPPPVSHSDQVIFLCNCSGPAPVAETSTFAGPICRSYVDEPVCSCWPCCQRWRLMP